MSASTDELLAGPIPSHSTDVVDEPWDGPHEVSMCPAARGPLRRMHAWVDGDADADTKTAYKFPHHKMMDDTPGPANVNGVRNALARLPQANIPEADRAGVRAHLTRHLDDFNERRESSSEYPRIVRAVAETPWAIMPSTLAVILDVITLRASGQRLTDEEIQARIGQRPVRGGARAGGAVAVLALHGVLIPRATLFGDVSGATSLQRFTGELREALDDSDVSAIVLDVDSPGGMVDGVPELAAEIRAARGRKPIVAVANTSANSAAYWLAAQADELVATLSGDVGSIGVLAAHEDISALQEKLGVKTTLISAGRHKTEGNPFEPLTDEARATIQERVDEFYGMFVQDVARGRGVSAEQVRDGFGEGRVVTARQALDEGMIDGIGTLEATVQRLAGDTRPTSTTISLSQAQYIIGQSSPNTTVWTIAPPGKPTDHDDDEAAPSGLSFADEAQAARDAADRLVERARSLAEVRRGRLTAAKREQLTADAQAFQAAAQALADLLAATDQTTAAVVREHARFLAGHHVGGKR